MLGEEKPVHRPKRGVERPKSFKVAVPAFLAPGTGFMGASFFNG